MPEYSFLNALFLSLEAIGQLFLIAVVGFLFVRRGHLDGNAVKGLSRLMIDVIVPCSLGIAMLKGFRLDQLTSYSPMLLFPTLWIVASALMVLGGFRLFPGDNLQADKAAVALSAVQNSFYIPLPVTLAIFPQHAELATVLVGVTVLAVNPLQWTLGSFLLMRDSPDRSRSWKKSLLQTLNPPVFGIMGGVLLSMFPPLVAAAKGSPESLMPLRAVFHGMEIIGRAMSPMAMIVLGALIAQSSLLSSVKWRHLLPILLVRFAITPSIIFLLLKLGFIPAGRVMAFVLLLEATSPSAMNLALAARRFEGEWQVMTSLLVVVNALAVLVLPLWMTVGLRMELPFEP